MQQNSVAVFISHHHSPAEDVFTSRLASDLRAAGTDVWVDFDEILSGDYREAIDTGLLRSDWLVYVMTPASLKSKFVREEVDAAKHRVNNGLMKGVIPIVAEQCHEEEIPPTLAILQRHFATPDYERGVAGLMKAIGLMLPPHVTSQASGILVVDQHGTATFRMIGDAISAALPGQTIHIRPGTYTENLSINKSLALIGEGDRNEVIIDVPEQAVVRAAGAIRFSNLTIRGTPTSKPLYKGLVLASTDLSNKDEVFIIEDCVLRSAPRNGIIAELGNVRIAGCVVTGCPGNAVIVGPSSTVRVSGSELDAEADGVYVAPRAHADIQGGRITSKSHGVWVRHDGECQAEDVDLRGCKQGPYRVDEGAVLERRNNRD